MQFLQRFAELYGLSFTIVCYLAVITFYVINRKPAVDYINTYKNVFKHT